MKPPTIQRIFLGLHQPPLLTAAERLFESGFAKLNSSQSTSAGATLDMSNVLIVVPTTRARHRLMQLLAVQAQERDAAFSPPEITTLGSFPEYLYTPEKLLATDLAQQIAWSRALEQTPDEEIECLTGRADVEDLKDWQPLARLLSRLHTRLASDVWSFRSVAREVAELDGFLKNELERWEVLREVQNRYYQILGKADLWDRQAARNYIAAAGLKDDIKEVRCRTDKDVVLVATADINRSIEGMLAQLTSQVTVMIAADKSHADRFDEYGNLITTQWLEASVAVPDDKILFVDGPADQAACAAHFITHLDSDYSTDEVTIGVPTEELIPQLQRSINSIELTHRNLAGKPLGETAPVRLMLACREYFKQQDYNAFAILLRHPDMYRWLTEQLGDDENSVDGYLDALDDYQNRKLPDWIRIGDESPFGDPAKIAKRFTEGDAGSKKRAGIEADNVRLLNTVHRLIASLLRPLDKPPQKISKWTEPWSDILIAIYGERELDRNIALDQQTLLACQAMHTALANHRHVPAEFGTTCSAVEALEWALEAASDQRVVDPPIIDAIEFAGWLDLPLDDAPVMAIVGMNDEYVPTSEFGHQFLPNKLCEQLGILDNNRRFARDVYALTLITSVRDDYLLISGRNNASKDPLKPSRLLFTQDQQTSAQRAYSFFSFEGKDENNFWLFEKSLAEKTTTQQFSVPRPHIVKPIDSMRVTQFKDYLKCPYRFYLQHVLRLDETADDWSEMSGGTFGDLAHDVLQSFYEADIKESKDDEEIFDWLSKQLDHESGIRFPGSRLPALRIQLEQLRGRLEKFSTLQAAQRQEGWQIVSCEELLYHELMVDNEPFTIRGKIDRVDRHEVTGQVAVWDYKTSDSGNDPQKAHLKNKQWIDLQLPLYRHLVREVDIIKGANLDDISLGYILLSKNLNDIKFAKARWDSSMLDYADKEAFRVIRDIRAGVFGPPTDPPPIFSEKYAAICQDNVFERDSIVAAEFGFAAEEAPPW
ncbi:PD-(D/E)XK nuclease family protein [Mariniblastus fucicola]|uniref:ATP-dependent helicase/deoxyribonuclease subunit B n=1 Tax=Mariniblastus fucicola TaxID=980251 RepID=A0A5B9P4J7_9BACT|nr:PD-(D/E)XK nuclease family protein [Mariniblastus fucicola]QEG21517.1 ATP-dependent helicase/deoxyribonuclease subunit B [Mariniblastus fucicola]